MADGYQILFEFCDRDNEPIAMQADVVCGACGVETLAANSRCRRCGEEWPPEVWEAITAAEAVRKLTGSDWHAARAMGDLHARKT